MAGEIVIRVNSQHRTVLVEREPAMPGVRKSSVPVRQMEVTGYRATGRVVVMLGNDIWKKDRAARFSMRQEDLVPLAHALLELDRGLREDLGRD